METRDKIIYEALSLFSIYGYGDVSVRQIASAVGIKESSLYNHFKNKQDILEKIIEETLVRYYNALDNSEIPTSKDKEVSKLYDAISDDDFLDMCTNIFMFYLKDDYISKLRRLLTIEQYSNEQIGELFKSIFIDRILKTQQGVLQKFIDSGRFISGDSYTMALHFYAPIFMLLYKYDNCPDKEAEAIETLKLHVTQYNAIYRLNPCERGSENK